MKIYPAGKPLPKRDYVYIDDLCSAIVKSINYEGHESIFNIGSGKKLLSKGNN